MNEYCWQKYMLLSHLGNGATTAATATGLFFLLAIILDLGARFLSTAASTGRLLRSRLTRSITATSTSLHSGHRFSLGFHFRLAFDFGNLWLAGRFAHVRFANLGFTHYLSDSIRESRLGIRGNSLVVFVLSSIADLLLRRFSTENVVVVVRS